MIQNGSGTDCLPTSLPAGLSEQSSQGSPPRTETHLFLWQISHKKKELAFEIRIPGSHDAVVLGSESHSFLDDGDSQIIQQMLSPPQSDPSNIPPSNPFCLSSVHPLSWKDCASDSHHKIPSYKTACHFQMLADSSQSLFFTDLQAICRSHFTRQTT